MYRGKVSDRSANARSRVAAQGMPGEDQSVGTSVDDSNFDNLRIFRSSLEKSPTLVTLRARVLSFVQQIKLQAPQTSMCIGGLENDSKDDITWEGNRDQSTMHKVSKPEWNVLDESFGVVSDTDGRQYGFKQ